MSFQPSAFRLAHTNPAQFVKNRAGFFLIISINIQNNAQ